MTVPVPMSVLSLYMAATPSPQMPDTTDERFRSIGPGFLGFVVTAALAIAVIFLVVDMTRRIRRIRYSPDQERRQADLVETGQAEELERRTRGTGDDIPVDPVHRVSPRFRDQPLDGRPGQPSGDEGTQPPRGGEPSGPLDGRPNF